MGNRPWEIGIGLWGFLTIQVMASGVSNSGSVPCPACGHDLRGVPPVENLYACPECGCVTDLAGIVTARVRRERLRGQVIIAALGLIILFLLVMLAT